MEAEGGLSLVEDCGPYRSKCGYCKARGDASDAHGEERPKTSARWGMVAHRLSPWHYQRLIDQGWRRSGRYLYRPRNSVTCCPQYTVRLDALAFAPDREQRRALARVGRFLETGAVAAAVAAAAAPAASAEAMEEDGGDDKQPPRTTESRPPTEGECQALQQALQRALAAVLMAAAAGAAAETTTSAAHASSLPAARVLPFAPHSHGSRAAPPGTAFTSPSVLAAVAALQPKPSKKKKKGKEEEQEANGNEAAAAASPSSAAAGAKQKKRLRGGAEGGSAPTSPREQQQQEAGRPPLNPGEVAARVAALLNGADAATPLPGGLRAVAAPTGHLNFRRAGAEKQQEQQHENQHQKQAGKKGQQQQQQQQDNKAAAADADAAPPSHRPSRRRFRLVVETVPSAFDEESFALYVKYQASQHGDDPATLTRDSYRRFLVDSPLFYARPPTEQAPSSLPPDAAANNNAPGFISERGAAAEDARAFAPASRGYGSYHQRYRLVPVVEDEEKEAAAATASPSPPSPPHPLVAVAVVDVLPGCLSSVYVFWDPDYAHLGLGRYTALREIEWVRRGLLFPNAAASAAAAGALGGARGAAAAAASPQPAFHPLNPRHYYLGYYIHSCPKMRYKGDYKPSQLLCHETGAWVPLSDAARAAIEQAAAASGGHGQGSNSPTKSEYVALGRVPALAALAEPNPSWSLALPPGGREPAGAAVPRAAADLQPVALPGGGAGGLRVARWAAARAALRQHGGFVDVPAIERRLRDWIAQVGLRVAPGLAEVLGELTGGGGAGGGGGGSSEEEDEEDEEDEDEEEDE